jgi:hypothetical protein
MRQRILIWLILLGCSPFAFAQGDDSPEHREWEATGFVGSSFAKNFELPTPVIGSSTEVSRTAGMHFASGYQLGARLHDNVNDHLGVDLEYTFAHQNLSFTNLTPAIQNVSVTQYVHYFSYNVAYMVLPPTRRFRPYADAGVGSALYFLPQASVESALEQGLKLRDSWVFLVNLGGGFKYLVRDQFAVTFDVKDRLFSFPSYGLPSSTRVIDGLVQPGIFTHGVGQTWQVNVGLTFQWDQYN